MKVNVICPECPPGLIRDILVSCELVDDGTVIAECAKKHRLWGALQNPKHEILFELGMRALSDGYHREAVMNMATALERCFEFFALAVMAHSEDLWQPMDDAGSSSISAEDLTRYRALRDEAAKWLRPSERQLGAFIFAHVALCGETPRWRGEFESKRIPLRNKVVHGGYIPTLNDVSEFAEWTYDTITSLIALLAEHTGDHLFVPQIVVLSQSQDRKKPEGSSFVAFSIPTVINQQMRKTEHRTFAEAQTEFKRMSSTWPALAELTSVAEDASVDDSAPTHSSST